MTCTVLIIMHNIFNLHDTEVEICLILVQLKRAKWSQERFKDTKGMIRSRKLKDRQRNGQHIPKG
jgi:DNA-binding CsgD family transcriptional regulator